MNPTRRSFFGKLGIGAALAAVLGRKAKAEEPAQLPVFIRKDGMLVDGEGKELHIIIDNRGPFPKPKPQPPSPIQIWDDSQIRTVITANELEIRGPERT